ncbi:MAG TPA: amidohydrolase family protein [Puia sp.]|nr:amidohydrolase family protein [Puia sp.]
MNHWSFRVLPALILSGLFGCGPAGDNEYYSLKDYNSVKKIDAHAHQLTARTGFVEQARADNFILLSLNTEVPDYPPVDSQQYYILQLRHRYPHDIYCIVTFETATMDQPGWAIRQLAYLKKAFDSGAVGVKVWKNIGMSLKDKNGRFIMIDDPVFDPIFDYLEKNDIPVIGHIGEPKNCWLPLDSMTTRNDSSYFAAHPQYHMYLHPEYPSYDAIIRSRDHLLEKHPNMRFTGAHLGSLEWDVDEIARRLDRFPHMCVDPAERLGQLQYQSIQNWQKVHDFFIKYQDRIMYGTDLEDNASEAPDYIAKHAHELWTRDWRYFTSDDSLESPFVRQKFKALHLPKSVIDKIYFKNAEKWYLEKRN